MDLEDLRASPLSFVVRIFAWLTVELRSIGAGEASAPTQSGH